MNKTAASPLVFSSGGNSRESKSKFNVSAANKELPVFDGWSYAKSFLVWCIQPAIWS